MHKLVDFFNVSRKAAAEAETSQQDLSVTDIAETNQQDLIEVEAAETSPHDQNSLEITESDEEVLRRVFLENPVALMINKRKISVVN